MNKVLNGKYVSELLMEDLKKEIEEGKKLYNRVPHLGAVLIGDHPASQSYIKNKKKYCQYMGIEFTLFHKKENTTEKELLQLIDRLNHDKSIDGYIVQLPLPKHIDSKKITLSIKAEKDVDGFHPTNLGKMLLGIPSHLPATPLGILKLMEYYKINPEGKSCVIVGRSHIVGTPMSILLSRKAALGNATVISTHSHTQDLASWTQKADILIVAVGKPLFIKSHMVKKDAIVIDVGIHRIKDSSKKGYHLCGDVDFHDVLEKVRYITPVPGGVGPMTIIGLVLNTRDAFKKNIHIE